MLVRRKGPTKTNEDEKKKTTQRFKKKSEIRKPTERKTKNRTNIKSTPMTELNKSFAVQQLQ